MALLVAGLVVGLLLLWSQVARLRLKLDDTDARLHRLERAAPSTPVQPETTPEAAPAAAGAASAAVPAFVPVAPPAVAQASTASVVSRAGAMPASVPPAATSTPVRPAPAAESAGAPSDRAGWEMAVGASWANKVGAAVTVIGLALALGYSMTTLGAAGRIAVGFTSSLTLLALGGFFERRPAFRLYSYGLTAAGWAGTYFTAYAMRNVPAAQVISSDVLGTVLLLAVASVMIWHTLRYRSRTVTALTYLIAFTTLGLSPLTTFSLVACLPLAVSLLVTSERYGWTDLSALGVASSYVIFVLRSQAGLTIALDPATWPSWAMLASLWLTFEGADLLSRRRSREPRAASLFALNAVGFMTAGLLHAPDSDLAIGAFAAAASIAYLASAIVRARVLPAPPSVDGTPDVPGGPLAGWTTSHTAVTLSAVMASLAIELRMDGLREVLAFLLVAEMVFIAGLTLGDRLIRHLGAALAVLTTFQLTQAGIRVDAVVSLGSWDVERWSILAIVVGGAWYAHRGWLRSRRVTREPLEYGYSWTGTLLLGLAIVRELQPIDAAVAGLALAAVLLEAGLRRGAEYRYQSYAVTAIAGSALALLFAGDVVQSAGIRHWLALPAGAVLAYWLAWRLASHDQKATGSAESRLAAGFAATLGTLFVALFERQILPGVWLGPAFAATGLALAGLDRQRHLAIFRWHAYALLVSGLARSAQPVFAIGTATSMAVTGMVVVAVVTYAVTLIMRGANRRDAGTPRWLGEVEDTVRPTVSIFATAALALLTLDEAPDRVRTVLWAAQGVALLAAGVPFRERVMRLSGLTMLGLAVGRFFLHDFSEQEALARILSAVSLGLFLLGVSWVYTRFRDRIQKYL